MQILQQWTLFSSLLHNPHFSTLFRPKLLLFGIVLSYLNHEVNNILPLIRYMTRV